MLPRKNIQHTRSNINSLKHFKKHHCFKEAVNGHMYMRLLTCYCPYCMSGAIANARQNCIHYSICGPWKLARFVFQKPKQKGNDKKPNTDKKSSKRKVNQQKKPAK